MNWKAIKIYTNKAGIDVLTGIIIDLGISGFSIEDSDDYHKFLDKTESHWDYVDEKLDYLKTVETSITLYIADNIQGEETLCNLKLYIENIKKSGDFGRLDIEIDGICEEDWENNWKKYFKPFKVGEKFYIKPSWETITETTTRKILEIDPASSFGTGTHQTTQLCISALEKYVFGGEKVLDMGTGSGILSIASHMLGAKNITAVDIDENSIKITNENAAKNNMTFKTFCTDVLDTDSVDIGSGFDIIIANIVADVIIAMKNILKDKLNISGILIISGIIESRADEVLAQLLAVGFEFIDKNTYDDWVCFIVKK